MNATIKSQVKQASRLTQRTRMAQVTPVTQMPQNGEPSFLTSPNLTEKVSGT